jgi:REP element-mobilizing transposase RayT
MARKLRIQYPGAIYLVMNRGDRREAIFRDDSDRKLFLATLEEACRKTSWQVHAYCLMGHHFHLVLETPSGNLVAGMKWFLGTYTSRFNRRHKEFGHLFSGRYKSLIVDGSGHGYLKTVCDYVHLNPARAKLLKPEEPLSGYEWSSYRLYLAESRRRPGWLRVDRLLGEWKIPRDSTSGRWMFGAGMEQRRQQDTREEFGAVERGWCLGAESFRKELLEQAGASATEGASYYGEIVREAAEAGAERRVLAGLKRRKWREEDLQRLRKGDKGKVSLALEVRRQTTMPLAWIATRLRMGSAGYVKWLLLQAKKGAICL